MKTHNVGVGGSAPVQKKKKIHHRFCFSQQLNKGKKKKTKPKNPVSFPICRNPRLGVGMGLFISQGGGDYSC
jgi:hypothetical protein